MARWGPILLWSSHPKRGLSQSSQNEAHERLHWIGVYNPAKCLAAPLPVKKSVFAQSYHTIMGWMAAASPELQG